MPKCAAAYCKIRHFRESGNPGLIKRILRFLHGAGALPCLAIASLAAIAATPGPAPAQAEPTIAGEIEIRLREGAIRGRGVCSSHWHFRRNASSRRYSRGRVGRLALSDFYRGRNPVVQTPACAIREPLRM